MKGSVGMVAMLVSDMQSCYQIISEIPRQTPKFSDTLLSTRIHVFKLHESQFKFKGGIMTTVCPYCRVEAFCIHLNQFGHPRQGGT